MIILSMMVMVYGLCCFGSMKRIAMLYFCLSVVNMLIFPFMEDMDITENSPWFSIIYGSAIFEEYLKVLFLIAVSQLSHRWLIFLLFAHIINHGYNEFEYELFNDAIIILEMAYFLRKSDGIYSGLVEFFGRVPTRNLRNARINGGHK